jgi:hypothetical protein
MVEWRGVGVLDILRFIFLAVLKNEPIRPARNTVRFILHRRRPIGANGAERTLWAKWRPHWTNWAVRPNRAKRAFGPNRAFGTYKCSIGTERTVRTCGAFGTKRSHQPGIGPQRSPRSVGSNPR